MVRIAPKKNRFSFLCIFFYSYDNPPSAVLNNRWLKMSSVQVLILVCIRNCTSNGSFFACFP